MFYCMISVKSKPIESVENDSSEEENYEVDYDQRQTGDNNIRVTVDGAKLILQGIPNFGGLVDGLFGLKRTANDLQEERSDETRSNNLSKLRLISRTKQH